MKTRLALAFAGLLLAGCSREPEEISEIEPASTPPRTYKHPAHGFAVRVPDGWQIKDTGNPAPIMVTLVSPRKDPADGFTETLTVQMEPRKEGLTAQQYFEASLAERRLVKDFQLLTNAPETIAGTEAVGAVARMDLGGLVVKVLSYTIVSGKNAYTLTAIATPDTFDEYKGIFRAVALAFEPAEGS